MPHRNHHDLLLACESAAAVALSVLLGTLRLVELPSGGSISLAALPLLVLAISRGVRVGVLAGCCAGFAHVLAGATIIHPLQLLLDYVAAYGMLGLAGFARGRGSRRARIAPAVTLAMLAQLACAVTSGVVFFAPVAGSAALGYSIAYNAATCVPELMLALWLAPVLLRALARANPADAWRRGLLTAPVAQPRTPRVPVAVPVSHAPPALSTARVPVARRAPSQAFVRAAPFAPRRAIK